MPVLVLLLIFFLLFCSIESRAITRDPSVYEDPDKFIPERWLPAEGREPPLDIDKVAFGVGRR